MRTCIRQFRTVSSALAGHHYGVRKPGSSTRPRPFRLLGVTAAAALIGCAVVGGCGKGRASARPTPNARASIAAVEVIFDVSKATSPQDAFPQEPFLQHLASDPTFERVFRRAAVTTHTWVERTAVVFSLEPTATRADVSELERLIRREGHVVQVVELAKDPCVVGDRCS